MVPSGTLDVSLTKWDFRFSPSSSFWIVTGAGSTFLHKDLHLFCIAIRSNSSSLEAPRNQAYIGPASTQAEMSCTLVGGSFICQVTKWAPNVSAADSASPGSIQVGFSLGKQGSYWVNINQYSSENFSWLVLFVRKATMSFLCPWLSPEGGKAHLVPD